MEIRRSYDRLISTMGFPILVRWRLYIESGPRKLQRRHMDHTASQNTGNSGSTFLTLCEGNQPVTGDNHSADGWKLSGRCLCHVSLPRDRIGSEPWSESHRTCYLKPICLKLRRSVAETRRRLLCNDRIKLFAVSSSLCLKSEFGEHMLLYIGFYKDCLHLFCLTDC